MTGTNFYFLTFWRLSWAFLAWTSVKSTQSTWTAETMPRTTWPRRRPRWWPVQWWTPSTRHYPGATATFLNWWLSWLQVRHTPTRPTCYKWRCPPLCLPRDQILLGTFRWRWQKVPARTWPLPWTSRPPRPARCPSLWKIHIETV